MANLHRGAILGLAALFTLLTTLRADDPPKENLRIALPGISEDIQKALTSAGEALDKQDWAAALPLLQKLLDLPEDVFLRTASKGPDGRETIRWTSLRAEAERRFAALPVKGKDKYRELYGPAAADLLQKANDPAALADVLRRYGHTDAGQQALARLAADHLKRDQAAPKAAGDWPVFRGNPARAADQSGSPPFPEPLWSRSTTKNEFSADPNTASTTQWIEDHLLKAATDYLEQRQHPILPAFNPVIVGSLGICRTHDGIYCFVLKDGNYGPSKREYKAGQLYWFSRMEGSLFYMGLRPENRALLTQQTQWINYYLQYGPQDTFFGNSVIGTLSADSQQIYAIDDLAVPPPSPMLPPHDKALLPQLSNFQAQIKQSKLTAYAVRTGKLNWDSHQVHESGLDRIEVKDGDKEKAAFGDGTFFLGPPLPLAGQLFVLAEKDGELVLLCVEPTKGKLEWRLTLASFRDKLPLDSARRVQAAPLGYHDGILICPTNAGTLVAVDLLTRRPVWAYTYDAPPPKAPPLHRFEPVRAFTAPSWQAAAPIIANGKVIHAGPDGDSVDCLSLRDGKLLWREKRAGDDLYLGSVSRGKVLIIGKNSCRALELATGKQLWRTGNVGIPSGHGAASGNLYYVPLRAAGLQKEPAVYGIDIDKGDIVSKTSFPPKTVPGNLLFHDGQVITQTVDRIMAFPQLLAKLTVIDERLKANPKDPTGLAKRGGLRLSRGQLPEAIDDLRAALASQLPEVLRPVAQARLFEALTDLLQRDFAASEKFLDEYRKVCDVEMPDGPAPPRRQATYHALLARGREKQGRLLDALHSYVAFAAISPNELMPLVEDPAVKVRPEVWARGRITNLITAADAAQRKQLDAEIARRWQEARQAKGPNRLREFVALFGSAATAGKEAKLALAERLLEDNRPEALREAQLHLLQLRADEKGKVLGGQAVEALARLMLRMNLPEHAAAYFRELGRNYAKTIIRDGKTGADFHGDAATDKRLQPFIRPEVQGWNGRFKASEQRGQFPMYPSFLFEPDGELLPFFQTHRAALDMNGFQLKFIDCTTGQEWWRTDRLWINTPDSGAGPANYLYNNSNVRHTYRVMGHLVLFNLGYMVYALDPIEKKKLWEINLLGSTRAAVAQQARIMPDLQGALQIVYADGWMQRIGQIGPVEPSSIAFMTRNGLVAVDPLTGTPLWMRTDVSVRTQIFGDSRSLCLVEMDFHGNATASRMVRAEDGVATIVPAFHEQYAMGVGTVGGALVLREEDDQKRLILRLYDVAAGKDRWKKTFAAGSMMLRTQDGGFAGAVESTGRVSVTDLRTGREVLRAHVPKEQVEKIDEAHLLVDAERFYLILNQPPDPKQQPGGGGPWTNVSWGMRALRVNGMVYAFVRQAPWWHCGNSLGEPAWFSVAGPILNQMLVLDQFAETPLLIFTARFNKMMNAGPNRFIAQQIAVIEAYEKETGKVVQPRKELPNTGNPFYGLNLNRQTRTIELVSHNLKVRFFIDDPAGNRQPAIGLH